MGFGLMYLDILFDEILIILNVNDGVFEIDLYNGM